MDIEKYKQQMQKTLIHLESELATLQLWRASSTLVESVKIYIPSWDMKQSLNQLANITIMDSQTIKIEPWDKWTISSIEKWIYESGLWLTPINNWENIMIKIPPMTKERRQDLTKVVAKMWEDTKVSMRNIRHDAVKEVKKWFEEKTISETDKKKYEEKIDEMIKEFTVKIDEKIKNKSTEIMTI